MKAAIIINSNASEGKSLSKWKSIESRLIDLLSCEAGVYYTRSIKDVNKLLPRLLHDEKCSFFIGGGGDGTINYLLNQLIILSGGNLGKIALGGIGLGSSNDFHKPIGKKLNKIPVRLDISNSKDHDIGQLEYTTKSGSIKRICFLLNSSIGLTATANQFFNTPNRTLAYLKRRSSSLSILYASIHTLFHYSPIRISANSREGMDFNSLNNISIVKSPYLSGSFCYPELVKWNDRKFGVYYCKDMNRWEVIRTMAGMTNKKFDDSLKRGKFTSESMEFKADEPVSIEIDGEVFFGKNPRYTLFKSQVSIASQGY